MKNAPLYLLIIFGLMLVPLTSTAAVADIGDNFTQGTIFFDVLLVIVLGFTVYIYRKEDRKSVGLITLIIVLALLVIFLSSLLVFLFEFV